MADRRRASSRGHERAPETPRKDPKPRTNKASPSKIPVKRLSAGIQLTDIGASRPPCSVAESEIALAVQRRLRSVGLRSSGERVRAPTSPTWAPLIRALLRVWAAAFLAAGWPVVTIGLAVTAVIGGFRPVAGLLRFVPLLGSTSRNVVALRRGTNRQARPLIVTAHLDSHPTGGAPLRRPHVVIAAASAGLALIAGVAARPGVAGWRPAAALIAGESILTLAWLARQELQTPVETPDDNTSGLLALVRVGELIADGSQLRDVWLVATAAGTSGSYGMTSFLNRRRELRKAWVVDIDALGTGEVVASPIGSRFPYPGTPPALTRAIAGAARHTGDPLTVRRVDRPHSDALAALRARTGAVTLTGGITPPAGGAKAPDPGNAERAARVVDGLARLDI